LKDARTSPERRPTALDVDRLRWLLTLAPRRDPGLAELLRQRFCPRVPEAALIEALAAPPLNRPPGVGPTAAEVHQFLLKVLDDSQPPPGSAGHERWRLDRALQQLPLAPEKAEAGLAELAAGPLGGEVERALRPLPHGTARLLKSKVLRPLRRRATREGFLREPAASGTGRRWTWPTPAELAAALIAAAVIWGAVPWLGKVFSDRAPVRQKIAYRLMVIDPGRRGSFYINVESLTRSTAHVYLVGDAPGSVSFLPSMSPKGGVPYSSWHGIVLDEKKRGHWYYARAQIDRATLAVSKAVWVEPAKPPLSIKVQSISRSWGDLRSRKQPVEVELRGGEVHEYPVDLESGQYVHLVVDQHGIDVALRVYRPDGSLEIEVDGPSSSQGQEQLSMIPYVSGRFRVEVAPSGPSTQVGRYEIQLDPLHRATVAERYLAKRALRAWQLIQQTHRRPKSIAQVPKGVIAETPQPPAPIAPKAAETTVERQGSIAEVKWDCGEERRAEATYELRDNEEFVAARVVVLDVEGAREYKLKASVYDEKLRQVRGVITFLGDGRISAANAQRTVCPGQARVRLLVTVSISRQILLR
jgi:hypothetical protein